jgi:alkylation response protein AidB-like acyl-CoA dehydrogenase
MANQSTVADRLRELRPEIAARADEIEQTGTIPTDLYEAIVATGYLRMAVPKRLGGNELSLGEINTVVIEAAYADSSVGWLAMIASHMPFFFSKLPRDSFEAMYADGPDVRARFVAAPKGAAVPTDGGYVVSGRWPFASGGPGPAFMGGGCMIIEDGAPAMTPEGTPRIIATVMPTHAIELLDTWHVLGMRGSDSRDFAAEDVFVPREWTFDLMAPSGLDTVFGRLGMAAIVPGHAAIALGIAMAARDELTELAQTKTSMFSPSTPLAKDPSFRRELGELAMDIDATAALLDHHSTTMWNAAEAGVEIDSLTAARAGAIAAYGTQLCARAVDRAYTLAGSASLYQASGLQRCLRDMHVATQHLGASPANYARLGAVLTRRPPSE